MSSGLEGQRAPATAENGAVSRLGDLASGLALLAGATFSITLALFQSAAPSVTAFVTRNQLEPQQRNLALTTSFGVAAVLALGLLAWSLYKRLGPSARILRWGKLACPLLIVGLLPALFTRRAWAGLELQFLIALGVVSLVLERLIAISLEEMVDVSKHVPHDATGPSRIARWLERARATRWIHKLPFVLVCAAVLYYVLLIGTYTLGTHVSMQTTTADLGEYDNQFFNALHGHPFRLPASEADLRDWSALRFHAEFVMYLLLPFYALKPGPPALLIIQTVFVALTAIPIYLFGARRLPRWIAAVVAVAFLSLPVVERPNFYDFHFVPIGMFFAAWAIWAVDRILHAEAPRRRDYVVCWLAFVLACLSREDIAFGMVIVSAFLVFYGKAPKLAIGMLVFSALYFVLIKFFIMPRFGEHWFDSVYDDIKAAGIERYGAVVATMLTNPVFVLKAMLTEAKLLYVLHFIVPLQFLWLRRPYLLVATLPTAFFTLMVTNRPPMFQTSFQYSYQWFPYIVIASLLALQHIRSASPLGAVRQAAAALALCVAAAGACYQYGVLLGGKSITGGFVEKRVRVTPDEWERYRELKALVAQIPTQASVAATDTVGPHVSTRLVLYSIKFSMGDNPEYIVFQRSIGGVEAQRILAALKSGEYGVMDRRGPFVLARRGHAQDGNLDVIRALRHR